MARHAWTKVAAYQETSPPADTDIRQRVGSSHGVQSPDVHPMTDAPQTWRRHAAPSDP